MRLSDNTYIHNKGVYYGVDAFSYDIPALKNL